MFLFRSPNRNGVVMDTTLQALHLLQVRIDTTSYQLRVIVFDGSRGGSKTFNIAHVSLDFSLSRPDQAPGAVSDAGLALHEKEGW